MKVQLRHARSFLARALGLLAGAPLRRGEGLLIQPCAAIHTWGMRYAIDVVFLDRNARVLAIHAHVRPWRALRCRGAAAVLELRAGDAVLADFIIGRVPPGLPQAMEAQ